MGSINYRQHRTLKKLGNTENGPLGEKLCYAAPSDEHFYILTKWLYDWVQIIQMAEGGRKLCANLF